MGEMSSMEKMMKSAVFYGRHDIRVEEVEMPKLNKGEVMIKVMACGVCGSDLHIYEGDQGSTKTIPPLIPGHEFSGIIVDLADDVKNCKIGDHVCVDPADNCGECYYCTSGQMSHCDYMNAIGTNVNGGFSQYCKVKSRLIHHLEKKVSFIEGAMAEPLACCINGIDRSGIRAGDNVVIYGGGMIGLIMLQLAKIQGASKVVVVEPIKERRDLAIKLGAAIVVDPLKEKVSDVLSMNDIKHVQVILECCGLKRTSEEALDIVDKHGTIVLFAVTAIDAILNFNSYTIFQKEISIKGSFCSPYTMGRAVELINAHRIDLSTMLGGVEPLEMLPEVLKNEEIRRRGKYVIVPNQEG